MATEFPLTNLTQPTMQNMNRLEGQGSFEGSDLCSPMSIPSGSGSPVYGPSVNTKHEQFVNVGPVDPNGAGQRKGNRKGANNNRKNTRGLSPTNTQPYSSANVHPHSRAPVGAPTMGAEAMMGMDPVALMMQQQQLANSPMSQHSPSMGGAPLSEEEIEHQRLEEFAALQAQMQMMQYNNATMMTYFNQMGMQVPLHMLQGGMQAGRYPAGSYPQMEEAQMPMHNGGFTMPPHDRMAAMDYHQMMIQQQGEEVLPQHQAPVENKEATPAKQPIQRIKIFATPEPTKPEKIDPIVEEPVPQPKLLATTPSEKNTQSQGVSPEEFTPNQRHEVKSTPQRRDFYDRPAGRSHERQPRSAKQDRRNNGGFQGHEHARELFSVAPQAVPKTKVMISGHFGRKSNAKSSLELKKGDYVIFDGDRGVELGEVVEITPLDAKEIKRLENSHIPHGAQRRGAELVHRLASDDEVFRWKTTMMVEAAEAAKQAQLLVQDHGLPLTIRCGSYQFDGKKLTFFYEADTRVDFRKLLAEMFGKFHCRIWMESTSELAFVPKQE